MRNDSGKLTALLLGLAVLALMQLVSVGANAQIREFRDCDECPVMLALPGGQFARSATADGDHIATSVAPFAVAKFEVTVGEYRAYADATGATGPGCRVWTTVGYETPRRGGGWPDPFPHLVKPGDDHAVVCLSWDDTQGYLAWLNERTGQSYRLLTEAEWEFAARGGLPNDSNWWVLGHMEANGAHCENCSGTDTMGREDELLTEKVGAFRPNPFGLHDMLGNAAEWLADCYNPSIADAPADGGAAMAGDCGRRIVRGGTWHNAWSNLAGWREGLAQDRRTNELGFRIGKSLPGA